GTGRSGRRLLDHPALSLDVRRAGAGAGPRRRHRRRLPARQVRDRSRLRLRHDEALPADPGAAPAGDAPAGARRLRQAVSSARMTATAQSAADPLLSRLYRVQRVTRELADTATLELTPLAG